LRKDAKRVANTSRGNALALQLVPWPEDVARWILKASSLKMGPNAVVFLRAAALNIPQSMEREAMDHFADEERADNWLLPVWERVFAYRRALEQPDA
jgi:hypothetical protein